MNKKSFFLSVVFCLFGAAAVFPAYGQQADSGKPAGAVIPAQELSKEEFNRIVAPSGADTGASPASGDETGMKEKLDKKISLDLRDMNIIDVLKFLAIKGDFNIVTSKAVEGKATLLLNNVSIADALEIILTANDLAYTTKRNIIYVMNAAEYLAQYGKKFNDNSKVKIVYLKYARPSYVLTALQNIRSNFGKIVIDEDTGTVVMIDTEEKLREMEKAVNQMEYKTETKVITLMYAKAETVAAQLKAKLDAKAVGSIQFDERSNQVIINALPQRMSEIVALVSALDSKTKAVLLEARILQVTLKPQYDMGINWNIAFSNSDKQFLRSLSFQDAFPASSTNVSTSFGKIAVGNVNFDNFSVELKALKQVSSTKLLADPRIMVVNNQQAVIQTGERKPYVLTTTTGTGDTQTTSEAVNWINVGLTFTVTPTINDNGYITLKIKPEITSQTSTYTTPKGALIPVVNSTLVETSVLVKDGNTVIIGGLVQNDKSTIRQGIPGLMDVPLVGRLFKNDSDQVTNSEIVIFITPRIVQGDTELASYEKEGITGPAVYPAEVKEGVVSRE